MLVQQLKEANINALKAHDTTARSVLSVILNKVKLAEIDRRSEGKELSDADVVAILQKSVKELTEEREAFAAVAHFKGSLRLKRMLAEFFRRYEADFAPEDGIAFGPVKLYGKEEMDHFLLVDEAPFPMARRVSEFEKQLKNRVGSAARRLQNWFRDECDRRAALLRKQVSDPAEQKARLARLYQSRDERIKQIDDEVKPFIKATLAALPSTEPLALYRAFWEDALAQLPPAEEAIEQFLRAKCKSGAPDRAACKRLSDALLRRGFSWQDIRPALSRLGEELPED